MSMLEIMVLLVLGVVVILLLLLGITKSSSRYYKNLEKINQAYGNGKAVLDDENWLDN